MRLTRIHPPASPGAWRLCLYPQVALRRVPTSAVRSGMKPGWRVAVHSSRFLPPGNPDLYGFLSERLAAHRVTEQLYSTRRDALWAVERCLAD